MHMDYWESLTNRIHGSFSSRSTMRVLVDPLLCLARVPSRSVRYLELKVSCIDCSTEEGSSAMH